ncbi:MAG: HDOD domain-containing protein [bacterium]|nr:HDOD domain-containing protein [bacterium]
MSSALIEPAATEEPWSLRDLPPFPWVTTKVLQLFVAPIEEIEMVKLTDLIRADASLSSEVLRRANSAAYGFRSQVSSIEHAVAMIGFDRVRSLTLTVGIGSYMQASMKLAVLRRVWRHCLGVALIAEELADAFEVRKDQAYTAGLLHDVGRLGLLVKYPQSYADLLSVCMENNFSLMSSERDLFDLDHCEAGAWLAQGWEFPTELIDVIAEHHAPPRSGDSSMLHLTNVACRLAECIGFEVTEPGTPAEQARMCDELPKPVRHLAEDDLDGLKARVTEKVNSLE